jgi:pyruvate dehydrogenase (quinone)
VPPIPPHATAEQAESMMQAVLKGDPEAFHLVAQGIKTKLQEAMPGRHR